MIKSFIEDEEFENINFQDEPLKMGEYDNCIFSHCNFSKVDLMNIIFTECRFEHCDFSNATIANTAFRDVIFSGCKLLGLHFEHCNTFRLEMQFDNCSLNFSSFYELSLPSTLFQDCSLEEVDFSYAQLSKASFKKCNLKNATFEHTNLEQADFRTAFHYTLDPAENRIKKAKFSKEGIGGLLKKYQIIIE